MTDSPTTGTELESTANDSDDTNWEDAIHPELRALLHKYPTMTIDSWWKARLCSAFMHIPGPLPTGVKAMKVRGIGSYYFPSKKIEEGSTKYSAAILWAHGGGRIMGSASGLTDSAVCSRIVNQFGLPVLSAHYRLAPRHPFPAALDDIRKAYNWLANHIQMESTNAETKDTEVKVAVAGESAGAGLVAELCQRMLDESQEQSATASSKLTVPLPVCQLLIYPMLDDRTCVDSSLSKLRPHLVWNSKSNMYGWSSYLGPNSKPGDEILPEYASASRRTDLSNLPPAFILVGKLDLLYTECVDYACRLKDDGVETEFVEIKGGFHGMMSMGKNEEPIVEAWERFQTFGTKFLLD